MDVDGRESDRTSERESGEGRRRRGDKPVDFVAALLSSRGRRSRNRDVAEGMSVGRSASVNLGPLGCFCFWGGDRGMAGEECNVKTDRRGHVLAFRITLLQDWCIGKTSDQFASTFGT